MFENEDSSVKQKAINSWVSDQEVENRGKRSVVGK
jgi:hypothetical protein